MPRMMIAVLVVMVCVGCGDDDQPTPPAPAGSCCAPDGTCTVAAQTECGGTWKCGGVCEPSPCPQPPSADMVLIPAGAFTMGSPASEMGRDSSGSRETQHEVTLTKAFYLCDHEVTQAEWFAVIPIHMSEFVGDSLPVESVSWYDCIDYCNARSLKEGLQPVYTRSGDAVNWDQAKTGYRLPTEAEWEYACRAGSAFAFSNGDITSSHCSQLDPKLDQMGWYCGNSSQMTHPVGRKEANAWGLYDMHGNVREWCWDRYAGYPAGPVSDPAGPSWGDHCIFRGGSWIERPQYCRSADRLSYVREYRENSVGVRVARTAS